MKARTAAKRLGDTQYDTYLNGVIFELSDVVYTREEAARTIGPSLTAVSRLNKTLASIGIGSSARLSSLGIGDLAAIPGVGLRQLEIACVVLDVAGQDVDTWLKGWEGRRKTAIDKANKRGAKRKAGKRTYRKG